MSILAGAFLPGNSLCDIRETETAGRGVFALQAISTGTTVHATSPAPVHVIYRIYRREACNWCWTYNNGLTYKISFGQIAWFCSEACREEWERDTGDIGREAWAALAEWQRKARRAPDEPSDVPRPSLEHTNTEWATAEATAARVLVARTSTMPKKAERKALVAALSIPSDDDALSFLLSALLAAYNRPDAFGLLQTLERVDVPYRCAEHLRAHTNALLVFAAVLPPPLLRDAADALRTAARADAHNSFGIWSGPHAAGEMLGYGIWPDASFFNHACAPTIAERVREGRIWRFVASRHVAPNEQLTISYLSPDEQRELDVHARRAVLHRAWGFECACSRCNEEVNRT